MPNFSGYPHNIGGRARAIRRRRGLGLKTVADMVGITKSYLSRLETGEREFVRRGLIEDLAEALGCSVADLTGGPDILPDRHVMSAASAIPGLTVAMFDTTLDDWPDIPTRPLTELVGIADAALAAADEVRYVLPGRQLGDLMTELHVIAGTATGEARQGALVALVEVCMVARSLAGNLGHDHLAVVATRRGWEAARRAERPDLAGLMAMGRALSLNRMGARRHAGTVLAAALTAIDAAPPSAAPGTAIAEATGMLHLASAHLDAQAGRLPAAQAHLQEAADLASHLGERNHMHYHFGPSGVAAWRLAVAVETERGPDVAETIVDDPTLLDRLGSPDRRAAVHFDLARAFAQDATGARDDAAVHHLDLADRIAPLRVRPDPLAREVVAALDRRAKRQLWELGSLKRRVGVA